MQAHHQVGVLATGVAQLAMARVPMVAITEATVASAVTAATVVPAAATEPAAGMVARVRNVGCHKRTPFIRASWFSRWATILPVASSGGVGRQSLLSVGRAVASWKSEKL